jgi:hypothetical protein
MRVAMSGLRMVARSKVMRMTWGLSVVLLTTVLSSCSSVVSNSASFYKDIPRRPINWREYMTD